MTAACGCCHDVGWTATDLYFECDVEHHALFDFGGTVLMECPHCHDDVTGSGKPTDPRATQAGAQAIVDALAAWVLAGKYDELGIHHGELRQQRAADRLERITQSGHYATGQISQFEFEAVAA